VVQGFDPRIRPKKEGQQAAVQEKFVIHVCSFSLIGGAK